MNGPSPHLSWNELACRNRERTPYPVEWAKTRAVILAAEFEKVRALAAQPIHVGSGYRTPSHNLNVGGYRNSQHVEGRALDIYPAPGMTVEALLRIVRAVANDDDSAIWGVGQYPTFIHLDTRPRPRAGKIIMWQGARAWAELKGL